MTTDGITIMKNAAFPGSPQAHFSGRKFEPLEARIRAIAAETGMSLTDLSREALRCYVIQYDKPLEPKA